MQAKHEVVVQFVMNVQLQAVSAPVPPAVQVDPDAEFGCMSAFYGPLGTSWGESALLRVDLGE